MDSEQAADDGERPEGLWDDAELVIYTTEVEDTTDDPQTEWGEHLGVLSFSLWARLEGDEAEIPIYHRSETGAWFSMSARQYHPDPAAPVSDAFVNSVVNMVNEDTGEGWGDPTEEAFEAMTDVEKQLWGATRWAFLSMESPEAAGVIDWCEKHTKTDPEDTHAE